MNTIKPTRWQAWIYAFASLVALAILLLIILPVPPGLADLLL